jgi:4-aminobutyrate aminotransferase-like enzyme
MIERVVELGEYLGRELRERILLIQGRVVRGLGLMWGVDFMPDKKTLEPFPRSMKILDKFGRE